MSREDVFIANVLKCRPPGNRDPQPDRDRGLPALPAPAGRADRAAGDRHARQLRDQAAHRQPDRDHQGARHAAGARARRPHRLRDAALHPAAALRTPVAGRDAARGLREAARAARRAAARARSRATAPRTAEPRRRRGRTRPTSSTCSVEPSRAAPRSAARDRGARRPARRAAAARRRRARQRRARRRQDDPDPRRLPGAGRRPSRSPRRPSRSASATRGRVPVSHLDLYRLDGLGGEDPGLLDDYLSAGRGRLRRVAGVGRRSSSCARVRVARRVELRHAGGDRREIERRVAAE